MSYFNSDMCLSVSLQQWKVIKQRNRDDKIYHFGEINDGNVQWKIGFSN